MSVFTSIDVDASGNRVAVMLGKYTKRDGTAPIAVYCHGHGGDAWAPFEQANLGQYHNTLPLAEEGYIVVSSDMGGLATHGNPTAQASVDAAILHAQTRYGGRTGKVLMTGTSMGGGAALTFSGRYPAKVAGVIVYVPIIDLAYSKSNGLPDIDAAYSGGYSDANYGLNHSAKPQAVAGKFANMPIRMWYAENDSYVPTSEYNPFLAAIASGPSPMINATMLVGGTHSEVTTQTVPVPEIRAFAKSVLPL